MFARGSDESLASWQQGIEPLHPHSEINETHSTDGAAAEERQSSEWSIDVHSSGMDAVVLNGDIEALRVLPFDDHLVQWCSDPGPWSELRCNRPWVRATKFVLSELPHIHSNGGGS